MGARNRQRSTSSPKVEIGEIDTSTPFQSVKDAVNLFGESGSSGEKTPIKKSAERVLAKETQLHLAQRELNKLKDQLQNAESTKSKACMELEMAKRTVQKLSCKLKTFSESKELSIKTTDQASQLEGKNYDNLVGTYDGRKQDLDSERAKYRKAITELDAAKQELRRVQLDHNASLVEKCSAFMQAMEAEHITEANRERATELSKEITAAQESIGQVKLAMLQAQQEQAKKLADKDVQMQSHKSNLEKSRNQLLDLEKEYDPELTKTLELQVAEKLTQIETLQKETENARTLASLKNITLELDDAKESLHKVEEEEISLRNSLETLKLELENVKNEHSKLKEKEAQNESVAANLQIKIQEVESEYEAALVEVSVVEEMIQTIQQLSLECENAMHEAEELKKKADELKSEAEATRITIEEAERRLKVALDEAEEAKADEARAIAQIKTLSDRTTAAGASTSGARLTISREEFESLSRKIEESDKLAEMKVAAALAQVLAIKANEDEALNKVEATQKEIADLKVATQETLKRAEMAEAAQKAIEGKLRRWREREEQKAAEAASRILAETHGSFHHRKSNSWEPTRVQKLEKGRTSSKKKLIRNLSGIFHRKKSQGEGGWPSSYLPGEKHI